MTMQKIFEENHQKHDADLFSSAMANDDMLEYVWEWMNRLLKANRSDNVSEDAHELQLQFVRADWLFPTNDIRCTFH